MNIDSYEQTPPSSLHHLQNLQDVMMTWFGLYPSCHHLDELETSNSIEAGRFPHMKLRGGPDFLEHAVFVMLFMDENDASSEAEAQLMIPEPSQTRPLHQSVMSLRATTPQH